MSLFLFLVTSRLLSYLIHDNRYMHIFHYLSHKFVSLSFYNSFSHVSQCVSNYLSSPSFQRFSETSIAMRNTPSFFVLLQKSLNILLKPDSEPTALYASCFLINSISVVNYAGKDFLFNLSTVLKFAQGVRFHGGLQRVAVILV